ncbi:MAG: hypothetical protein NTW87_21405, partial [Planctomycetota bacterium]|nr:hypothetical protein [Planctomycetota bacterium]
NVCCEPHVEDVDCGTADIAQPMVYPDLQDDWSQGDHLSWGQQEKDYAETAGGCGHCLDYLFHLIHL